MSTPVIITVAITGAVPRKTDNPAVPVTPAEQIESTHEAFEAGASLVHVHVDVCDRYDRGPPPPRKHGRYWGCRRAPDRDLTGPSADRSKATVFAATFCVRS